SPNLHPHSILTPRTAGVGGVAARALGRLRAESEPTWVASGRTGVRAKAAIHLRARNRLRRPTPGLPESMDTRRALSLLAAASRPPKPIPMKGRTDEWSRLQRLARAPILSERENLSRPDAPAPFRPRPSVPGGDHV